jgi:hypothetical protein
MSPKGLTNDYLEKICKKILPKTFLGVFACDRPPKVLKKHKFSLIFNTGLSSSSGEHFVAVFVKNKRVYYFDSFGEPISNHYIASFLSQFSDHYYMQYKKIQDDLSNFCGFYCLAFLINMYKDRSTRNFISQFKHKTNLMMNDQKVVNFIISNIE